MARGGAALFGFSAVQSASAKAGQFSKLDIFSVIGEPAISSPYQPGGPKPSQINSIEKGTTTYGFSKSDGPILADGFRVSQRLSWPHLPSICSRCAGSIIPTPDA